MNQEYDSDPEEKEWVQDEELQEENEEIEGNGEDEEYENNEEEEVNNNENDGDYENAEFGDNEADEADEPRDEESPEYENNELPEESPVLNGNEEEPRGEEEENEEGFVADEENEEAFAEDEVGEYEEVAFTDPKVLIAETHRIEESTMILMRGLSSLLGQRDDEVRVNLLDICADLAAEEENLFSLTPEFVHQIQQKQRSIAEKTKRKSKRPSEYRVSGLSTSNYSQETRAFVDPRVPLKLPFNPRRNKSEHPERSQQRGTYHELFYGDPNAVEFKAPEDNKRRQIEDYKKAHPPPRSRDKPVFEPKPKKPMKVSKDFVPSCAEVDNSEARKRLKESKTFRNTRLS